MRYFWWKCHSNVSDTAYEKLRIQLAVSGCYIKSLRATRYYLQTQLGIHIQEYHRCINNCMVFIGNDLLRRKCRFCDTPRFFKDDGQKDKFFPDQLSFLGLIPCAIYSYIPLIPRLQLWYANPDSALKMRYPTTLIENPWERDEGVRDVWEGCAMRHWKAIGFFDDERTVALHFSTDGVQLFRNSTQEVWPFLILNLNLPPEER